MKFLKIAVFISVGLIITAGVILAVFLALFDIEHYKPRITQELSSLSGRDVQIDQLRLDFKIDKGLSIAIKGLSIADDPAFSRDKALAVDSIYLNMDLLALIFQRQIAIAQIEISGPRVYLVRNKEGLLNVQTLLERNVNGDAMGGNLQPNSAHAAVSTALSAPRKKQKEAAVIPWMLIQAVRIEHGVLTFVDESFDPPLIVPLRQIDLEADRLSLTKFFPFEVKALLWADQQNITADGEISIDLINTQANVQKAKLKTDLSQLRLRTLPFYGVLKEQLSLEGELQGKVLFQDIKMQLGQGGLGAFSASGELSGGKLSSELLEQPLEDIHGRFQVDESNIDIGELVVSYASGTASAHGRWSDYGKSNMLMSDIHIDGLQLGDLIPRSKMPVLSDSGEAVGLEGGVYSVFDVEGRGAQIQELRESFQGNGSMEVRGGKLSNINLLRFVLNKLSFIPDLVAKIEENLPPRYKNGLQAEETVLERVVATAKLKDQSVYFNAELQADGFTMALNGNLNFDENLTLTADFFIPEDLASNMIGSVPELSYLSDGGGQIHIPFTTYQGAMRNMRLYPDVEELAKEVIQNRGKEELKKAIFRALDIEDATAPPQQTQGQAPARGETAPQEQTSPGGALIDGIFDAIFRGKERLEEAP